ncbi:hypothetical protein ACOMHN_036312 [Nucella lapillus]
MNGKNGQLNIDLRKSDYVDYAKRRTVLNSQHPQGKAHKSHHIYTNSTVSRQLQQHSVQPWKCREEQRSLSDAALGQESNFPHVAILSAHIIGNML